MTEAEWLACADPMPMLEFLRGRASDRKLRLFAVACCRRIWPLLTDERSQRGVEIGERYADGLASEADLEAARQSAARLAYEDEQFHFATDEPQGDYRAAHAHAFEQAAMSFAGRDSISVANLAAGEVAEALAGCPGVKADAADLLIFVAEMSVNCGLLRDILGSPFRHSLPLPPSVLAWNDGTVRRIAKGIYEERLMPAGALDTARLAFLADTFLEAGCDNEELIAHCRSEGPHFRGCWAIDLILDKK